MIVFTSCSVLTVLAVLSMKTGRTRAAIAPMGIGTLSTILTWVVLTLVDV